MGVCTVNASLKIVKFWQGIVEVFLRIICIVLVILTFISVAALAKALSAPETPIIHIENLRYNTRSSSGWILFLTLLSMPLIIIFFILRLINLRIFNDAKILLLVDITINIALAIGFFCGAIPLAVHANDWKYWRGRGSNEEVKRYNLNNIIASSEAASAFSFLSTFLMVGLIVWMILSLAFGWNDDEKKYLRSEKSFSPKVKMITKQDEETFEDVEKVQIEQVQIEQDQA